MFKKIAICALLGLVAVTNAQDTDVFVPEAIAAGEMSSPLAYITGDANGSTCGGNCPSGTCSSCKCGTSKNVVNIANECSKYTGWSQSCCQCIISHESGG